MPRAGSYTMGGIFKTGTHGSVFTHVLLADMILSIVLVLADSRTFRIEPKNGIIDPVTFA